MRRCNRLLWLMLILAALVLVAPHAFAQETAAQETAALDSVTKWKIINTAIFAIGLGWFIWKYAPAFFNARSTDIQKAIKDATGLKIEADFRYSEIDRKMASLADEVRRLREQSKIEMERDHGRFREQTRAEIEHINRNVRAEIEAFRQEGIRQVRQHAADLAVGSAERRLEDRFRSAEQDDLLQDFIHLVERGRNS